MHGIERRLVLDDQRQVMQTNYVLTVKWRRIGGILGLPQRDHNFAIRQECCWIIGHLTDLRKTKGFHEEDVRLPKIWHSESYMMYPLG